MVPESEETPTNASGSIASTHVTLDKAEHDRLQAENRRMAKVLRERESADDARRAKEAADAAVAAGEFNKALELERAEKARLTDQLKLRDRRDTLQDEILKRTLTGSQARMLTRLVDVSPDTFDAANAVESVMSEYPDLFAAPQAPQTDPVRRGGPVPPAKPGNVPFEGYISPEEYGRFPHAVRLTPKFQERVAASRAYWPTTFDARDLPRGNE